MLRNREGFVTPTSAQSLGSYCQCRHPMFHLLFNFSWSVCSPTRICSSVPCSTFTSMMWKRYSTAEISRTDTESRLSKEKENLGKGCWRAPPNMELMAMTPCMISRSRARAAMRPHKYCCRFAECNPTCTSRRASFKTSTRTGSKSKENGDFNHTKLLILHSEIQLSQTNCYFIKRRREGVIWQLQWRVFFLKLTKWEISFI